MDKVILGEGVVLNDGESGFYPNNNQVVVGCSGTGKSFSTLLPTILNMQKDSLIGTYPKPDEGRKIAYYLRTKAYKTYILDLTNPSASNVSINFLDYLRNYLDVEELCTQIVLSDPASDTAREKYWNDGAICLLYALMVAVMRTKNHPTMTDVLDLFDQLKLTENGRGITTSLDDMFDSIEKKTPDCPSAGRFNDFRMLPYSTAGCIRDTLAKALRRIFPEPAKVLMRHKNTLDFTKLATEKSALLILTSPVCTSMYGFANLISATAIKQLLEFAQTCPGQRLPVEVRLLFDDFACGATIHNFCQQIAIFRAAGLSAMMLIQSESQLISMYSEAEATTLLNNVCAYAYFPGGMDLATCRSISQRLDVPLSEVMYAPPGQTIVMRSGAKPVKVPRYDILHSAEYQDYLQATSSMTMER